MFTLQYPLLSPDSRTCTFMSSMKWFCLYIEYSTHKWEKTCGLELFYFTMMVSIYSYLLLHLVCGGGRERESTTVCVIRGQHAGAGSLLYHVGSRNQTQIIRFRSQHVCYLSIQPTPVFIILRWCEFIFPYSQIKLHCVYIPHFLCAFFSWWTPRLIL